MLVGQSDAIRIVTKKRLSGEALGRSVERSLEN